MTDWNPPNEDQLAQLQNLVARRENRAYFFDRLENPEWVSALAERGFFSAPPEPEEDVEQGTVRFPPWPEGRYLARMAPVAPDDVAAVLEQMQPTANPTATSVLLEAAQALPDGHVRQLAPRVVEWIEFRTAPRFGDYFAEEAAGAVIQLGRLGKADRALKSARALLALEPRAARSEDELSEEFSLLRPKPVGRLSDWNYERAVERLLPGLVDAAGMDALSMFSALLNESLRLSSREGEPTEDANYSYIWRPAVEEHEQNSREDVRCLLVAAVRDAAVRFAQGSEGDLEKVVLQLEKGTVLHRRIALHVLAYASNGVRLVTERITDRALFEDYRLKHEYAALLRSRFGDVSAEARRTFLGWVLDGPDLDDYRRLWSARDESTPSDADEAAYVANWQRDWLSFVDRHLTEDTAALYQQHLQQYGAASHPDFLTWTSSFAGSESPVTKEEMSSWPPDRVIEYLRAWSPELDAGHFGPSREDLGSVFEEVVSARVGDFVAVADEIALLEPTYVRHCLDGIREALKQGAALDWSPVLRLMASVAAHEFEDDDEVPRWERDPGWRWARGDIPSLIQVGVSDREHRIPFENRHAVWQILERLTHDPDPTPVREASDQDGMGAFTLSMNTNRGKAMREVVSYALWCRRELDTQGAEFTTGFSTMPEVRAVLEKHLQPELDPSIAVRAVYGERLPWLALLDEDWVAENAPRIFPSDPEFASLRDAAWNTYICWCEPHDPLFELLRVEYEAAIERVPSGGDHDLSNTHEADQNLGEHLATYNWRGLLPRSMLDRWFEVADDPLVAHTMDFVGRALRNTQGDVAPAVLQRIQELWEQRLAVIEDEPEAHRLEASAFASTFVSSKLDEAWSLKALERALVSGGPGWLGSDVIEHLAEITASKPATAARLTLRILEGATRDWDHTAWRDEVRKVLEATAGANDAETIQHRSAIIDHYVRRGYYDFKELDRPSTAPLPEGDASRGNNDPKIARRE